LASLQFEVNSVNRQDPLFIGVKLYFQIADIKNIVSHGIQQQGIKSDCNNLFPLEEVDLDIFLGHG
jgi:hypothetical protein